MPKRTPATITNRKSPERPSPPPCCRSRSRQDSAAEVSRPARHGRPRDGRVGRTPSAALRVAVDWLQLTGLQLLGCSPVGWSVERRSSAACAIVAASSHAPLSASSTRAVAPRWFTLSRPHAVLSSPIGFRLRMTVYDSTFDDLTRIIAAAAHALPAQGPIGVFVHHNTLHAFEDRPFEEGVIEAARVYGTEPFWSESRYRDELARGRILAADVDAVLSTHDAGSMNTLVAGGRVRLHDLHRALLLNPVRQESDAAVRWTLTESDVLERMRPDLPATPDEAAGRDAALDLWHACIEAVAFARPAVRDARPPARFRDLLLAVDPTVDTDALVHPLLIRICGAFLDQGVAAWRMPGRRHGLLAAAARLYGTGWG
ncbi:DUF2309 family protein, partial [bacterium]|nr:DUF2309 family protein [bacterium]